MTPIGNRHWTIALAGALAAHGALLGFFWQPAPNGAKSAGLGGIEVSLGVAGSAPGKASPVAPTPADAEDVAPKEVATVETVRSTEAVETAREVAPAEPVEQLRAVEPVESVAAIQPVEARRPVPPPPKRKPDPPKAAVPPEPAPVKPAAAPEVTPMVPEKAEESRVAATAPGAGGRAGTTDNAQTGSGQAQASGGLPGSAADYMSLLQAWLEKHKEYPRAAQLRREEGVALLWFAIDRDGRVLDFALKRPSGHTSLDREVVAMIKRADPLPRMPDDMARGRLEVVVPVQFRLR